MDFEKFNDGLRALGLPNEYTVFLTYAVLEGITCGTLGMKIGSHGMDQLNKAIALVEAKRMPIAK